jgi:hypothetical protein
MRWKHCALIALSCASLAGASLPAERAPDAGTRPRAQQPAPNHCDAQWPDRAARRWSGRWNDREGWVFTYNLTLRRDGAAVSGEFLWRLATARDASMANRVGHTATERVRGTIDCAAGTLAFAGYEVTDGTLIARDVYRVAITVDRRLTGQTRGNEGHWDGVLTGTERP